MGYISMKQWKNLKLLTNGRLELLYREAAYIIQETRTIKNWKAIKVSGFNITEEIMVLWKSGILSAYLEIENDNNSI